MSTADSTERLRLGFAFYAEDAATCSEIFRTAEESGCELLGFGDSQSLWLDAYVGLTLGAAATSRALLGTMVSNPLTRHVAVSASAIASVQDASVGRAFFGIGSGDSSVLNLGRRPAGVADLERYAVAVRELCLGRGVEEEGREIRLRWDPRPVPVVLSAEGPRTLRAAGRVAAAVVVSNGMTREVVTDTLALVAEGAAEARREPPPVWWMVKNHFAESHAAGLEALRWTLAASVNHVFRFTLDGKRVPDRFTEDVRRIQAGYAIEKHGRVGQGAENAALVDNEDLLAWLGDRFAVTGTPEECAARLEEMAAYGVRRVLFTRTTADWRSFLRTVRDRLAPELRSHGLALWEDGPGSL